MFAISQRSTANEAQRLFLALWPDEAVRTRLAALGAGLRLGGGRRVAASNLHVTLIFLGAIDALRRPCIERAAASVAVSGFAFDLTEMQWRRHGGIVWATATEAPAGLYELLDALNSALVRCGHAPERRQYRLHVSLARNVRRAPPRRTIAPIRWQARDFCLVSSVPGPGGSAYTVERRWPLA